MRISDWSSDVCSSDLAVAGGEVHPPVGGARIVAQRLLHHAHGLDELAPVGHRQQAQAADAVADRDLVGGLLPVLELHHLRDVLLLVGQPLLRSEEHTSELQSLMRISYAVFCLKKKTYTKITYHKTCTIIRI